jgi:hypothetical protein
MPVNGSLGLNLGSASDTEDPLFVLLLLAPQGVGPGYSVRAAHVLDGRRSGGSDVTFLAAPWTADISHGEMLRAGYDEMQIEPTRYQYLYQGFDSAVGPSEYNLIPWKLGLLTLR